MLDLCEDAEERNLELVNLVAACSYDDTPLTPLVAPLTALNRNERISVESMGFVLGSAIHDQTLARDLGRSRNQEDIEKRLQPPRRRLRDAAYRCGNRSSHWLRECCRRIRDISQLILART